MVGSYTLYWNEGNQIIGFESRRVGKSLREILFTMYISEENQMMCKVLSKHGE